VPSGSLLVVGYYRVYRTLISFVYILCFTATVLSAMRRSLYSIASRFCRYYAMLPGSDTTYCILPPATTLYIIIPCCVFSSGLCGWIGYCACSFMILLILLLEWVGRPVLSSSLPVAWRLPVYMCTFSLLYTCIPNRHVAMASRFWRCGLLYSFFLCLEYMPASFLILCPILDVPYGVQCGVLYTLLLYILCA